jgi:hypothetical protein
MYTRKVVSTYPAESIVVSLLLIIVVVDSLAKLLSPSESVGVGGTSQPVRVVLARSPPR